MTTNSELPSRSLERSAILELSWTNCLEDLEGSALLTLWRMQQRMLLLKSKSNSKARYAWADIFRMNAKEVAGRPLTVNVSIPREQREPGSYGNRGDGKS